jgi:hypothetical protein
MMSMPTIPPSIHIPTRLGLTVSLGRGGSGRSTGRIGGVSDFMFHILRLR